MIGETIAHYRITAKIGEGGMGEVYRATDTKLRRDVALKFLPDHFLDDADRLSRFQREAQVLASLNHPNIAQVYGLEESGDARCIVMELVEGETLADRIARGPIPVEEALNIAHQIADGLEAAHERSIIHRDLKPANVKVTPDGKVKVLDFGLAKGVRGNASGRDVIELTDTHPHAAALECRSDHWHRRIHVTRAGARLCCRPAQRCLFLRLRALRDAHREAGFPRGHDIRHPCQYPRARAEPRIVAREPESEDSRVTPSIVGEESEAPLVRRR